MHATPPTPVTVLHSAPVYSAPTLSASAARHLVFVAGAPETALQDLLRSAGPDGTRQVSVVTADGVAADDLPARLQASLAQARVGTHLYLLGSEAVVWRLYNVARDAGMQSEEISLLRTEGSARSVYCVHCGQVQPVGAGTTADCAGCGVRLFVREHFSRRLGAFMGVCEDPDHPRGRAAS